MVILFHTDIYYHILTREPHRQVQEVKLKQEEIDDVRKLDSWQPAKPISTTVPQIDPADLKKY